MVSRQCVIQHEHQREMVLPRKAEQPDALELAAKQNHQSQRIQNEACVRGNQERWEGGGQKKGEGRMSACIVGNETTNRPNTAVAPWGAPLMYSWQLCKYSVWFAFRFIRYSVYTCAEAQRGRHERWVGVERGAASSGLTPAKPDKKQ